MGVLLDNLDVLLGGFRLTVALAAVSAVGALVLGTLIAAMRVAPVAALRSAGSTYVNLARNTPLTLMFAIFVFGLPELGVQASFFVRAVLALTVYTAAFVAESVRSGINAVQAGQAEAARAVGMTFGQTVRLVVLPQAFRSVLPPLASVFIALIKNTSVAAGFGITEAVFRMGGLGRDFPAALFPVFFGVAFGYIVLVAVIALFFRFLETRLAVAR